MDIQEAILKKLGISEGLRVEKATITVCAGSDDVVIESVLLMAAQQGQEADARPLTTPPVLFNPAKVPFTRASNKKSHWRAGIGGRKKTVNLGKPVDEVDPDPKKVVGGGITKEEVRKLRVKIHSARYLKKLTENQELALKALDGRASDLTHPQRQQLRDIVANIK